jgi:hypothetical protein
MRQLIPYEDYSRQEVHDLFDPGSQSRTWGLHGFVELPDRPRDWVVTFGQSKRITNL